MTDDATKMYQLLADATLILHAAFVVVVVLMVPLILVGGVSRWAWVRVRWVRLIHLAGIGIVVAQAWAGVVCPLTILEMWLRRRADDTHYAGSFIEHWLQRLLYWEAPAWVFATVYTAFALVVLAAWLLVPPRRGGTTGPGAT
jgi:polyferredoxin